jgi:anaerobic selenocysteine-containing dehydrogenase
MTRPIRTACTRHCGDGCALLVTPAQDGRLLIRGNPDHPFTQGFICAKTTRFGERLASPRRIVTPLIREHGSFREASWDEALGLVAAEIARLRPTPERMLHVHYYASFGLLHQASKLLFKTLGVSGFSGSPCLVAGMKAQIADFGAIRQGLPTDLLSARRIVNWGRNASAQSVHQSALITTARARGARVLAIHPGDPGHADLADENIVIRPGTDRFLAMAALRLLLDTNRLDSAALARCLHGAHFLDLLRGLDMAALLAACGASPSQAETLADFYAGDAPTATLIGRGLQRHVHGGESVRCIDALAMLSGHVGRPGGGVYYLRPDSGQVRGNWAEARPGYSRSFPLADLAANVEKADPPVEFVWVEGMNLVTQCPDSLALQRMLAERFTVVVDAFMTDTARCARVILPPALMLECEDLVQSESHNFVHHAAQVVPPRGQALPNFEIAARLGALLDSPVSYPAAEEVLDAALRRGRLKATLADLRASGFLAMPAPGTPWQDGRFAHPDGLFHLPETLSPAEPASEDFPLHLLSPVRRDHLLSQIPEDEQTSPPTVFVSPRCAALAGLDPSRTCRLETVLGAMPVRVAVLPGLDPHTVLYPRGDWLSRGGCVNRLIRPLEADLGGQIAYYAERARLVPDSA